MTFPGPNMARRAGRPLPDPIPDTLENAARAEFNAPPNKWDEWKNPTKGTGSVVSRPKHHLNPRRDLLRFTDNVGKFYYFRKDRADGRVDYRSPRSVMWSRGYYDLAEPGPGEDAGSVEQRLQQVEEAANRVIDGLLDQIDRWKSTIPEDCSNRRLDSLAHKAKFYPPIRLSDSNVDILKVYIPWKFMRSRRREEVKASSLEKTKKEAAKIFGQEAVDALDQNWLDRFLHDTANRILGNGPSHHVRAVIAQKGLVVSTSVGRHIAPLVASDNPVFKAVPKGMHLLDESSEIVMPISKDSALSICGTPGVRFNPNLNPRTVRILNEEIFFYSNEVVCSCKEVLESLVRAWGKGRLYPQK